MIIDKEGLPEIHETYYWFGKINEVRGIRLMQKCIMAKS